MRIEIISPAMAAVFDQFGAAAIFTPVATGVPADVRAIRMREDAPFGQTRSPGWLIQLLQADVPLKPVEGDTITLATVVHRVRAVQEGPQRLSWVCDVDEVTA